MHAQPPLAAATDEPPRQRAPVQLELELLDDGGRGRRYKSQSVGLKNNNTERARQVFSRSLCRPVRLRPPRVTHEAVLATRAPPARGTSITLVWRNV